MKSLLSYDCYRKYTPQTFLVELLSTKPSYEELGEMLKQAFARIKQLEAIIAELEKKPKLSSRNSGKPASSDPPWEPKSERQKSQRSSGGQEGHEGNSLAWRENVDKIVVHQPKDYCDCGVQLDYASVATVEKRQVLELPTLNLRVTEPHCETRVCACGLVHHGSFPRGVEARMQYGQAFKGLALSLMNTLHEFRTNPGVFC